MPGNNAEAPVLRTQFRLAGAAGPAAQPDSGLGKTKRRSQLAKQEPDVQQHSTLLLEQYER